MHFEGNDLNELEREINFDQLNRYLTEKLDFGHIEKIDEKTSIIEDYLEYKINF